MSIFVGSICYQITTEWSEIFLLNYLHSMTELMENLMEREQILNMLNESLINMTDDMQRETEQNTHPRKQVTLCLCIS